MLIRPVIRPLVRGVMRPPTQRRGGSWNPASLFAGGQEGAVLDFSDAATLYQDSAGTTAGVLTQPLGLGLDKRLGATRSANKAASANYGTQGGKDNTTTALSDTSFQMSGGTTQSGTFLNLTTVVGYAYEVVFTVDSISSGVIVGFGRTGVSGGGSTIQQTGNIGAGQTGRIIFIATATNNSVLWTASAVAPTVTVSGISVREIPGNHVLQATSASRPTWQQQAAGWYAARADGFDDSLSCATGGGGNAGFFLCAAVTVNGGAGTDRAIFSDSSGTTGYHIRIDAGNTLRITAGNGAATTGVSTASLLPVGETHVVTIWDDGTNLNAQVDNAATANIARPVVVAGTAGFTMLRHNGSASEFFNGDLHSLVYRKDSGLTAAERALVKTWVGKKVGLTL
jgi:hypothetical protein